MGLCLQRPGYGRCQDLIHHSLPLKMVVANNGCIDYVQLITPGYYLHLTKIQQEIGVECSDQENDLRKREKAVFPYPKARKYRFKQLVSGVAINSLDSVSALDSA